jgi:hypothetical protein
MRVRASFVRAHLTSPVHVKFSENATLDPSDAPVYRSGRTVLHSFPSKTEKNSDADSVYRIHLRVLEVLFHITFPSQFCTSLK